MSDTLSTLLSLELRPAQQELLTVTHNEPVDKAIYMGGVGSGKSFIGLIRCLLISQLYPGSRILVGSMANTHLEDSVYSVWRSMLEGTHKVITEPLMHLLAKDDRHHRVWPGCPDEFFFANGSFMAWRHFSDPGRLLGPEWSTIFVDECREIPGETWDILLGRLRWDGYTTLFPDARRRRYIFGCTNPEINPSWLFERFIEPEERRDNERFISAPTTDNECNLPEGYIEEMLSQYDEELAEIYIYGKTGKIGASRPYRSWDRERNGHRKAPFGCEYTTHGEYWAAWDHNVDPATAVIGVTHKDGKRGTWAEIIDEVWLRNSDTEKSTARVAAKLKEHGIREVRCFADASGSARSTRGGKTDHEIIVAGLKLEGIQPLRRFARVNPRESDRLNCFNTALKAADGKVRLYIHSRCRELILDLERVRYKQGTTEIEKPKKGPGALRTHISDAAGYAIHQIFPMRSNEYSRIALAA